MTSFFCTILCHETTASGLVVIEIVLSGLVLNKIKQKETEFLRCHSYLLFYSDVM